MIASHFEVMSDSWGQKVEGEPWELKGHDYVVGELYGEVANLHCGDLRHGRGCVNLHGGVMLEDERVYGRALWGHDGLLDHDRG